MASTIIKNPYIPPVQNSFVMATYADVSAASTSFSSFIPCGGSTGVWGTSSFSYADREFAPSAIITSSFFSYNTTNVASIDLARAYVNGHTALIRMRTYIKSNITDTAMALGTFQWSYLGVSAMNTTLYIPAFTDGGNAFIMGYLNAGSLQITDVVTKTTATSVAASSGDQKRVDWTFAVPIDYDQMLDSACAIGYYLRS